MNIIVRQGNIVEVEADAIVNAANTGLLLGSGVAGAIREAGGPRVQEACDLFQYNLNLGGAVATGAGDLPYEAVIHAASVPGPGQVTTLGTVSKATRSALLCAEAMRLESIVMPALGAGVGGLPLAHVCGSIVGAIRNHRQGTLEVVILCAFDDTAYLAFKEAVRA